MISKNRILEERVVDQLNKVIKLSKMCKLNEKGGASVCSNR